MRRLFLTSAGLGNDVTPAFLELLSEDPKGLKLAFIPTAANCDNDPWWVKRAREGLLGLGFKLEEVDLEKVLRETLRRKLETCKVIYVCGGNTFYLLKFMRESGFMELIPKLLDMGIIYVGESAGSVVAGPNIEIAGWPLEEDSNDVGLTDFIGLNLVPFSTFVHFEPHMFEEVGKHSKDLEFPVCVLSNSQAVKILDEKYDIVGIGDKVVLVKGEKYEGFPTLFR